MYPELYKTCEELALKFEGIPFERKLMLNRLSDYINLKLEQNLPDRKSVV